MMYEQNGEKWRLQFKYTPRGRQAIGAARRCRCTIEEWCQNAEPHPGTGEKPGRWVEHANGEARCSKLDNFSRETGRRLAMRRAYVDLRVKAKRTGYKWDDDCPIRKVGMGLVAAYFNRPTGSVETLSKDAA